MWKWIIGIVAVGLVGFAAYKYFSSSPDAEEEAAQQALVNQEVPQVNLQQKSPLAEGEQAVAVQGVTDLFVRRPGQGQAPDSFERLQYIGKRYQDCHQLRTGAFRCKSIGGWVNQVDAALISEDMERMEVEVAQLRKRRPVVSSSNKWAHENNSACELPATEQDGGMGGECFDPEFETCLGVGKRAMSLVAGTCPGRKQCCPAPDHVRDISAEDGEDSRYQGSAGSQSGRSETSAQAGDANTITGEPGQAIQRGRQAQ